MGIDDGIQVPVYRHQPRGTGYAFEEKLIFSGDGFNELCRRELSPRDVEVFHWDVLVPIDFEGPIDLPLKNYYSQTTTARSAQRMLPAAMRLAAAIELPAETPKYCDNLQLTSFFGDFEERGHAANVTATGPWRDDLGMAFHTALYLRAAEHSIRRRCPIFCS
ncbi:hypothetical protein ACFQ9X_00685 [Catenulispora yoronensis]